MIKRFCLYSFLLRQEYFAPFIVLAFMEKGLSFTQIGLLVAIREILVNLLEIPSGAIADSLGRRKTLVTSFLGYIFSFFIFAVAKDFYMLIPAMCCFSIGEAFRTGTHKAMIFEWLLLNDRKDEKVKVYGVTRSWGKIGGAICVIPATLLVCLTQKYSWIFYLSVVPYLINCLNVLTYPKELDGNDKKERSFKGIFSLLKSAFVDVFSERKLRAVVVESMCYEGLFKVSKDFLQPVLKMMVLTLPILVAWESSRRTAVLVGVVYFALNLCSGWASRKSGLFMEKCGGEVKAAHKLWLYELLIFVGSFIAVLSGFPIVMAVLLVILLILQNLWKPVQVARCADLADKRKMATVLSIQSQVKSLFLAVVTPIVGYLIDVLQRVQPDYKFLPIACLGVLVSGFVCLSLRRRNSGCFEKETVDVC